MTETEPTSVKWRTSGLTYSPTNPEYPRVDREIEILEESRSVNMDPGKDPYGRPIDAHTAVHLIRNYIDFVNEAQYAFTFDKESIKEIEYTLKDIFNIGYGITFDKNIILKVLSQPKCEGIRSYLCLRKPHGSKPHISLVVVGVDCEGKDLHYTKEDTIIKSNRHDPDEITGIKTQSLTGEFAHPPGSELTEKTEDYRYSLLKMANELPK